MERWTPTHEIAIDCDDGTQERVQVMLVDADGHGHGPAYTREEWDASDSGAWCCDEDDDGWYCQGQVTPGGRADCEVTVRRLSEAQQISARFDDDGLRWRDEDDIHLGDVLEAAGARRVRTTDRECDVWVLSDDSAIATTSAAWDVVVHVDDLDARDDHDCDGEAWVSEGQAPDAGWICRPA